MKATLLACGILLWAPVQCGTDPNERALEDSPAEALWRLSERFAQSDQVEARRITLRQIIDEYPSSRFAQRARVELGVPQSPSSADDQAAQ